jgi:hypothetical protein
VHIKRPGCHRHVVWFNANGVPLEQASHCYYRHYDLVALPPLRPYCVILLASLSPSCTSPSPALTYTFVEPPYTATVRCRNQRQCPHLQFQRRWQLTRVSSLVLVVMACLVVASNCLCCNQTRMGSTGLWLRVAGPSVLLTWLKMGEQRSTTCYSRVSVSTTSSCMVIA